jgi:hypothetical protein
MASGSEELINRVEKAWKSDATFFGYYSLALEDSKDVSDTVQLAIVLRGVRKDLILLEKWLPYSRWKSPQSQWFIEARNRNRLGLSLTNLSEPKPFGAPKQLRRRNGLVKLLKSPPIYH